MGEEHGEGQQVGGDQVLRPQLYQPDTECGICHISLQYHYMYQKVPGPQLCHFHTLLTNDRLSNDFSKLFFPFLSILPHIIAVPLIFF